MLRSFSSFVFVFVLRIRFRIRVRLRFRVRLPPLAADIARACPTRGVFDLEGLGCWV